MLSLSFLGTVGETRKYNYVVQIINSEESISDVLKMEMMKIFQTKSRNHSGFSVGYYKNQEMLSIGYKPLMTWKPCSSYMSMMTLLHCGVMVRMLMLIHVVLQSGLSAKTVQMKMLASGQRRNRILRKPSKLYKRTIVMNTPQLHHWARMYGNGLHEDLDNMQACKEEGSQV